MTLVPDLQDDLAGISDKPNPRTRAARVPVDVGEALLDDAEQGVFHRHRQAAELGRQIEIHGDAAAPAEAFGAPAQSRGEADLLQQWGVQEIGKRSNLLRAPLRQGGALVQGDSRPLVKRRAALVGHRQIHRQGRQALSRAVMQLPGQPVSLLILHSQQAGRKLPEGFLHLLALHDLLLERLVGVRKLGGPFGDPGLQLRVGLHQIMLRPLALDELSNLAADGRHHLEEGLVGLQDPMTEELQDSEHLLAQEDREGHRGVEPHLLPQIAAQDIVLGGYIRNPEWAAAAPDPACHSHVGVKGHFLARLTELAQTAARPVPFRDAAEQIRLLVDLPDFAEIPSETFADGLENSGNGHRQVGGLRQDARHGVIDHDAPLRSPAVGDVPDRQEDHPRALPSSVEATGIEQHRPQSRPGKFRIVFEVMQAGVLGQDHLQVPLKPARPSHRPDLLDPHAQHLRGIDLQEIAEGAVGPSYPQLRVQDHQG